MAMSCACNEEGMCGYHHERARRYAEYQTAPLRAEIDAAWEYLRNGYDIEPREYFEKEAPRNGFKYALAMAMHHIWKRELKVRQEV